jgi:hypothetical protein
MKPKVPMVDKRFSKHLLSEDELGAVVRTHIHIEAGIRQFVEARVNSPTHLPRLTYEARLRLAIALGFPEEYLDSLKYLGDMRNTFGHNLDAQLSDATVQALFSKLPEEARIDVVQNFESLRPGDDFAKAPPKDRFVIIAAILNGTVMGITTATKQLHAT